MLSEDTRCTKIVTPTGLELCVSQSGVGSITCIFIHGSGDGGFVWEEISKEVSPYFRTLTFDLRGHGNSSWDAAKNYYLENYISDIEFSLEYLGVKECILVGHSLGGDIATRIIKRRPKKTVGAVLVDAGPLLDLKIRDYVRAQILESYRIYRTVDEYASWLRKKRPLITKETVEWLSYRCLRNLPTGEFQLKFDLEAVRNLYDGEDERWWWQELPLLKLPILLIRGAGSAILSKEVADMMVKMLPRGKLVTVESAGHAVMSDNPAGFSNAIKPFLIALRSLH